MSEGYMRKMRWMLMVAVLATAAMCEGQQAESKGTPGTSGTQPQPVQAKAEQTQAVQEEKVFHLVFVVAELDENGKVVNSRRFDTMVNANARGGGGDSTIQTGAKVPITEGSQVQYVDLGVTIYIMSPRIVDGNRLTMQVHAEVSSIDPAASTSAEGRPIIRQNKWNGHVQVPIGERKVIYSSDDLASKRSMQIEVTATPVR